MSDSTNEKAHTSEEPVADRLAAHKAAASSADELAAAIRAITADGPDGLPNGPAEEALQRLAKLTRRTGWPVEHAGQIARIGMINAEFARMCEALAYDTRRLRLAAEDYLGGDFSKPDGTTHVEDLRVTREDLLTRALALALDHVPAAAMFGMDLRLAREVLTAAKDGNLDALAREATADLERLFEADCQEPS